MVRGIYTAASGMLSQEHNLDTIANNLANMDQTGFKRDTTVFKSFPEMLLRRVNDDGVVKFPLGSYDRMPVIGTVGTGVETNEVFTEFEQGAFRGTENPFDFALDGQGFFTVQTKDGLRYTRNGSFLIDKDSFLVTKDGNYVLGENGPIQVKKNNFSVNDQGEIVANMDLQGDPSRLVSYAENDWKDTQKVDKFMIVEFRQPRGLKKQGDSYYRATEEAMPAAAASNVKVQQGFLEMSNVNPVMEMTRMIEVQRTYEANQRILQSHDQELGKLINEVGRAS
jgi:flagellar basal-body rod protein FlgG